MKNSRLVFVVFVLFSIECISQIYVERIEIVTPTAKQEATSIWQTINNIDFFEKQGYTINLPTDALIDTLITKSKKGAFGNKDYNAIYNLVETKIFDPNNYHVAIRKVENQSDLIGSLVHEIEAIKSQWDWEFKLFDTYKIIFTLYGTGGSYDPDKGTITLLTNREGNFINYDNPANTIIHEITHMGMEYSIVQKYSLSHGLKERIVDTFVHLMFLDRLPAYQIQNMGNTTIDDYLVNKKKIETLSYILKTMEE